MTARRIRHFYHCLHSHPCPFSFYPRYLVCSQKSFPFAYGTEHIQEIGRTDDPMGNCTALVRCWSRGDEVQPIQRSQVSLAAPSVGNSDGLLYIFTPRGGNPNRGFLSQYMDFVSMAHSLYIYRLPIDRPTPPPHPVQQFRFTASSSYPSVTE